MDGTDTYVFITDGTSSVTATDVLIKSVGFDATAAASDVLTLNTGDIYFA